MAAENSEASGSGERHYTAAVVAAVVATVLIAVAYLVGYQNGKGVTDDEGGAPVASEQPDTTTEEAETEQPADEPPADDGAGGQDGEDADGQQIFADTCAGCHGADGTGGAGPDLTALEAASDADHVAQVVAEGQGAMPSFEGQLSDAEIQGVASFVSSDLAGGAGN